MLGVAAYAKRAREAWICSGKGDNVSIDFDQGCGIRLLDVQSICVKVLAIDTVRGVRAGIPAEVSDGPPVGPLHRFRVVRYGSRRKEWLNLLGKVCFGAEPHDVDDHEALAARSIVCSEDVQSQFVGDVVVVALQRFVEGLVGAPGIQQIHTRELSAVHEVVEPESRRGDNAKVVTCTSDAPEEVGILRLGDFNEIARSGDEAHRFEVIYPKPKDAL